jgi:UDP-N-acetylmuramate: L-alanyl-gamma-D-glutamyl-meso-diaminopimelate ligase
MAAADHALVYFSHHALSLKGLPALKKETVQEYFGKDVEVIDSKEMLEQRVGELLGKRQKSVCLLLMSSGTFDGIDWNGVSSQHI